MHIKSWEDNTVSSTLSMCSHFILINPASTGIFSQSPARHNSALFTYLSKINQKPQNQHIEKMKIGWKIPLAFFMCLVDRICKYKIRFLCLKSSNESYDLLVQYRCLPPHRITLTSSYYKQYMLSILCYTDRRPVMVAAWWFAFRRFIKNHSA